MKLTPETRIISNGSKWAGEQPDNIEKLFERLETEPLDPRFEELGSFVIANPEMLRKGETMNDFYGSPGWVQFFGNFARISAVFGIHTNDADLIKRLIEAIRKNQQSKAYQDFRTDLIENGSYWHQYREENGILKTIADRRI